MSNFHLRQGLNRIRKAIGRTRLSTKIIIIATLTGIGTALLLSALYSWSGLILLLAGSGGAIVWIGLWIENEADEEKEKIRAESISQKQKWLKFKSKLGWWVLMFGISFEVFTSVTLALIDIRDAKNNKAVENQIKENIEPRHLTDDKKLLLEQEMKGVPPCGFWFLYSGDVPDSRTVMQDISDCLTDLGWKYDGAVGGGYFGDINSFPSGLGILKPNDRDNLSEIRLIESLCLVGIDSHRGDIPGFAQTFLREFPTNDVIVFIGRKPPAHISVP